MRGELRIIVLNKVEVTGELDKALKKKDYFFERHGKEREGRKKKKGVRERETDIFHMLVHALNAYNRQGCARRQELRLHFCMGGRDTCTWSII